MYPDPEGPAPDDEASERDAALRASLAALPPGGGAEVGALGVRVSLVSVVVGLLLMLAVAGTYFYTTLDGLLDITSRIASEDITALVRAQQVLDDLDELLNTLRAQRLLESSATRHRFTIEFLLRVFAIRERLEAMRGMRANPRQTGPLPLGGAVEHLLGELDAVGQAIVQHHLALLAGSMVEERRDRLVAEFRERADRFSLAVEDANRQVRALVARAVAIEIPDASRSLDRLHGRLDLFLEREMSWLGTTQDLRSDGGQLRDLAAAVLSAAGHADLERLTEQAATIALRISLYRRLPDTPAVRTLAARTQELLESFAAGTDSFFAIRAAELAAMERLEATDQSLEAALGRLRGDVGQLVGMLRARLQETVDQTRGTVVASKQVLLSAGLAALLLAAGGIYWIVLRKVVGRIEGLTGTMLRAASDAPRAIEGHVEREVAALVRGGGSDEIAAMGRSLLALLAVIAERDRARAEADLAAREVLSLSEKRLRQVIDLVPHFIFAKDSDGRFVLVNRAVAEAYGTTVEALTGKRDADFAASEAEVQHFRADDQAVIRSGRPKLIDEEPITDATGRRRLLTTVKIPFTFSGTSSPAVLGVSIDITQRTEAEARQLLLERQLVQSQKMESIGRLAGGIAHDLNNMLAPILGYAELLRDGFPEEDRRRGYTDDIVQAATHSRDLVQQLLAYARKQIVAVKPVDLNATLRSLERILRRTLRENVSLEIRLAPTLGAIEGEEGQLEQIVINLAVNAQDAMPDGGLLVLETREALVDPDDKATPDGPAPGAYVLLRVTDTGVGMDEATLARVFEPFFSTKPFGAGTGLGLSVVYGIMTQHGGSILVKSTPGDGTTFELYFPRRGEPLAPAPAPAEALGGVPGTGETILVVEDEELVRGLTCSVLQSVGYAVLAAASAQAAMDAVAAHGGPIHLLLTDVILPDVSGRDVYARLAGRLPGLRVLYMSGYAGDELSRHGGQDGGANFISKPFSVYDLTRKVRETLDRA